MNRQIPMLTCDIRSDRRGAIAVIAMIAILITISIGLGMVKTTLIARQETLRWQHQTQAEWLVEAGIERAVVQFESSPDYRGETWALSAEELGGREEAQIVIDLKPTGEADDEYRLNVIADYPAHGDDRIRSSKVITIKKSNNEDSDES